MSTTSTLLDQARRDYETQRNKLDIEFAKKQADLLDKVKTELAGALNDAAKIFATIPEDARHGLLSESMYADFLKPMGLVARKGKVARKSRVAGSPRASRITDEQILALIPTKTEKPEKDRPRNKDIAEKVGMSGIGIGARLKKLQDGKKIDCTLDGTSNRWFKL